MQILDLEQVVEQVVVCCCTLMAASQALGSFQLMEVKEATQG